MIKRVFLVFFTFLSLQAFSQESVFISATHPASCNHGLLDHIKKANNPNEQLDLLVKGDGSAITSVVVKGGGIIKFNEGNIYAIRITADEVYTLLNTAGIQRIEGYQGPGFILDTPADSNTHADSVKQGAHPLPQAYTGKGVVMGFIDVGIDITQPDFKDPSTLKTRIKYLWNQLAVTGGVTPAPFGYGQSWTNADIDAGTCTDTADPSYFGHGTNVAGAGCGNGSVNPIYAGIATQADIISVNVNLGDNSLNDIVDATKYIFDNAAILGEPCSINASVGNYSGSHDGEDLPGQMIASLISAQNGRSFCAASGDAGGIPLHLGFTVQPDSAYCWFKSFIPEPKQPAVVAYELWANKSQFDSVYFQFGADLPSPSFEKLGHTRYYNITKDFNLTSTADSLKDSLYLGPKRLGLITVYVNLVEDTVYDIFVVITPDSSIYLWRFTTKGSGYFDCWTNVSYTGTSNILKTGLPSPSVYPDINRYRLPDLTQNVISSYGCSDKVITVGNYVDRTSLLNYYDSITTFPDTVGAFFPTTSVGPTRDGRIKPEISSPGANIVVPGQLSVLASYIANHQGSEVAYGGNYNFNGGTSLASPIVAGIVALYFQRYPNASWIEAKHAIETTALTDQFTGNNLPNNKWGYGKVNAFEALNSSPDSLATAATITALVNHFVAFPNPTSAMANIYYELANNNSSSFIQITDLSGRSINMIQVTGNNGYYTYDMSQLAQGVYLCHLISGSKTLSTLKLMKL